MKDSLYDIPDGCICMGDGLFGMQCTAPTHAVLKKNKMTYEQEIAEAHLKYMRLQHQVDSQSQAIDHWRKQSDLDYVKIQRMYWALREARDYVDRNGGDPRVLNEIDVALAGVPIYPPKVFV